MEEIPYIPIGAGWVVLNTAKLGKEMVMDIIMETPEDTTFAFTDGSCQPNPGPCGAGAVLYPQST